MKTQNKNKTLKLGFTLLELLVVVLIIGILAGIAIPQYKKIIMKANLHKGVSLVESLYRAQQVYFVTHGNFSTDIDALDVEIPKNDSCQKQQDSQYSRYRCDSGTIGLADTFSNVQYITPNRDILYAHFFIDFEEVFSKNSRWCFAKNSKIAQEVCVDLGGKDRGYFYEWNHYELN